MEGVDGEKAGFYPTTTLGSENGPVVLDIKGFR